MSPSEQISTGAITLPQGSVSEICFVSHDARRFIANWAAAYGAGPFFAMTMPAEIEHDYRGAPGKDSFMAALGFMGTTLIEVIQPLDDMPSVFREVLDAKGEGAKHHVMPSIRTLSPADFDALCAHYDTQGFTRALSLTPPGMGRNILFDAVETTGVFVEVLEVSEFVYGLLEQMYAAHLAQPGDPVMREFAELMK